VEEAIKKANVLIEALPYIKAFHNKVTVIKYGGSILGEERVRKAVLEDIVFLSYMGIRPVLVHGGGPNISERIRKLGKKTEFVDGMRVTDAQTLKIVEEELIRLNEQIVNQINELGGNARGFISSNCIIKARKKKAKQDLGLVGEIVGVDIDILEKELRRGFIPIICPMGKDEKDCLYNINADEVAAFVASSLKAEKFVLLTNVRGIMRNIDDHTSLLGSITNKEDQRLIDENIIQQGMIPKVQACFQAINGGVKKAHIVDARITHALLLEIFTDQGIGTEIVKQD